MFFFNKLKCYMYKLKVNIGTILTQIVTHPGYKRYTKRWEVLWMHGCYLQSDKTSKSSFYIFFVQFTSSDFLFKVSTLLKENIWILVHKDYLYKTLVNLDVATFWRGWRSTIKLIAWKWNINYRAAWFQRMIWFLFTYMRNFIRNCIELCCCWL